MSVYGARTPSAGRLATAAAVAAAGGLVGYMLLTRAAEGGTVDALALVLGIGALAVAALRPALAATFLPAIIFANAGLVLADNYGAPNVVSGLTLLTGFAFASLLTLALAIGINSVVFTMVNGILLKPFPVPDRDRLAALWAIDERDHGASHLSYQDYVDWRDRSGLFTSLAAQLNAPLIYTDGAAEILWSELVTGNFFSTLGLNPEVGRFFVAGEEARVGGSPYVVLSYDLWQRRYQGDRNVIGRKVTVNQQPFEVIGVAPPKFRGLRRLGFWPEVWIPLGAPGTRDMMQGRGLGSLMVFGRLRPGLDATRANAQAKVFARSLSAAYPETNRSVGAMVNPAPAPYDSPRYVKPRVLVFAAALGLVGVLLVLLIACANVTNLLLARASARRREIAVRLSIGGSRARIIRQLLTESALLAMLGGLGGLGISMLASRLQDSMVPRLAFQVGFDVSVDHRVVLFTLLVAFAAVFFFGLTPALQATRFDLVSALRNDAIRSRRSRLPDLRSVLVGAQLAMSIVLLVAGTLFLRSLSSAAEVNFGFDPADRVVLSANPEANNYERARALSFYQEVSRRVEQEPGVLSASWGYPVPFDTNDRSVEAYVGGITESGERQTTSLAMSTVEPKYFETLGMPLITGRDFTPADSAGAPRVMIVNRLAAEKFWPGRNAIGQHIRLNGPGGDAVEVVGIVEQAVYFSPTEQRRPFAFFPVRQSGRYGLTMVVHTRNGSSP